MMRHPRLEQQIVATECMLNHHLSELNPDAVPAIIRDLADMKALAAKIRSVRSRRTYIQLEADADNLFQVASTRLSSSKIEG